ncbi:MULTISPECIES: sulfite exporter TauE/SafE family protein [unclassified Helicobacter]|uniref:sulfite exporter TauE/SafE family protein n=1 Tax=unclassified Helicobacter TaxID=2593540 RepID=UPI000CF16A55|nr:MULTISPECIES: sulfite exporter TauE/SafE family protein [unclassified Helicobacter]
MQELLSIFFVALSMSFAHCIGMCGGILTAIMPLKTSSNTKFLSLGVRHCLYNLGRITSYVLIGLFCGIIGYSINLNAKLSGWFLIFLGTFLVLFAFCYVFFPKIITKIEPNVSNSSFYKRAFNALRSDSILSFYALGVLNGFLPCGMVYYFAGIALMSKSVLDGILIMGVFGIATLIPMFIFGFILGIGITSAFRKIFLALSFIGMVGLGGFNIYQGITKLQNPSHQHHQNMQSHHCGGEHQGCQNCKHNNIKSH